MPNEMTEFRWKGRVLHENFRVKEKEGMWVNKAHEIKPHEDENSRGESKLCNDNRLSVFK